MLRMVGYNCLKNLKKILIRNNQLFYFREKFLRIAK